MSEIARASHRGGSGPPLVCLHGFMDTWRTWELVLLTTVNYEHLAPELLAAQLRGVAGCDAQSLLAWAQRPAWRLDAERVTCPVRIVWGTADALLPWPLSAARFRRDWLPQADWIELDGVGHCPQLDVPLEAAQLILGHTTSRDASARDVAPHRTARA